MAKDTIENRIYISHFLEKIPMIGFAVAYSKIAEAVIYHSIFSVPVLVLKMNIPKVATTNIASACITGWNFCRPNKVVMYSGILIDNKDLS